MSHTSTIQYFAVDWGTSNVRAWGIDHAGRIAFSANSDKGMSRLSGSEYEAELLNLIGPALPDHTAPVLICGMAGAKTGWKEAGYVPVPCRVSDMAASTHVATQSNRIRVEILPGLRQEQPEDVMRGEETQIAGVLANESGFTGVVCCPGTHSKWISVEDGVIVGFTTFMTGELFHLLSTQSVLKDAVDGDWDTREFEKHLASFMHSPSSDAMASLFHIRAQNILKDAPPQLGRTKLSAILIGSEIKSGLRTYPARHVTIVGADGISKMYQSAFSIAGVQACLVNASDSTLAGFAAGRTMSGVH